MKAFLGLFFLLLAVPCHGARLEVEMRFSFDGKPLAFDTLGFATDAGRTVSFTRCDLLLSSAALQKEDGSWISSEKWAAYISGRENRNRFALSGMPAGRYTKLRFMVGLPPETNLGDPAAYPAGHPLNPAINGMHWGWQGGYIFAALEGMWKAPGEPMSGYSFHLANNGNTAMIELPATLDLTADQTLRLSLDLKSVLAGIVIEVDSASTHSRDGDPIAAKLKENFNRAFRIESLLPTPSRADAAKAANALIAPNATPFRFRFSSNFPTPTLPVDNPLTREGVDLGRHLFHDPRLSGNGTQSCANCHRPPLGFSDRRQFSIGAFGDRGKRQSMPLFNLAWKSSFFWDGRAPTLREQVLMPIQDKTEMHASLGKVVRNLSNDPEYEEMFDDAFGSKKIDADRVARALEQFLLSIVSDHSKFDRSLRGDEELTDEEKLGATLFNTEYDPARGLRGADCFHCHGGPLFQSVAYANNGLDGNPPDIGRRKTTKLEGDHGKFAVPSLRNVAITGPYMHDGRFSTLEEVIEHYDHGLQRSPTLDPNLAKHPTNGLQLTDQEKSALVAFLKTLTDEDMTRPPPPPGAGGPGGPGGPRGRGGRPPFPPPPPGR